MISTCIYQPLFWIIHHLQVSVYHSGTCWIIFLNQLNGCLTLLHSEQPKLLRVLAILSAVGLRNVNFHVPVVVFEQDMKIGHLISMLAYRQVDR